MLAKVWEPSYPCTLSKPLKEDSSFCTTHKGVMHRQHVLSAGTEACTIAEPGHAHSTVEI